MKGTVGVRDLRVDCIIGIHAIERVKEQPLFLDAEVEIDFAGAARLDRVEATVDYSEMAAKLQSLGKDRKFQLIETYAEEAAAMLLRDYAAAQSVRIEIRKPEAVPAAAHSFCRVERKREAG